MPKPRTTLKILLHKKATTPIKVISSNQEEVLLTSRTCTGALWELAEKFPNEIIGWLEEGVQGDLALEKWEDVFHHNLIMASYAVKTTFLPGSIGYVDQLPFINVDRSVPYGSWLMSSDVGGIKGEVLLGFQPLFRKEKNLGYLLNSIAKIGQQNGLFCYSVPELVENPKPTAPESSADKAAVFQFVYQHYSTAWTSVLLLCFLIYQRSFPFLPYLRSYFNPKVFRRPIDLAGIEINSGRRDSPSEEIDVIIPTMGRPKYLHDVLKDLSRQTHLPSKVIIVEQNPEEGSVSQLPFLKEEEWPFEIKHHFIHRTGACNARNMALKEVTSEYVFFADDDIRLESSLLKEAMEEICRYQISAVNFNCKQPGETTIFDKIKQWGSFGAGTSIVKSSFAQKCRFSEAFEYGFGEDADFGMQLRNNGSDIIYHPNLQILHLKAPTGGFRKKPVLPWEQGKLLPKPSPTIMIYAIKHYTPEQLRGYKVSLFLKFYDRQPEKNPLKYFRQFQEKWRLSEEWAMMIFKQNREL